MHMFFLDTKDDIQLHICINPNSFCGTNPELQCPSTLLLFLLLLLLLLLLFIGLLLLLLLLLNWIFFS